MTEKLRVTLKYPNLVVDQFGNKGTWTMVYNQVKLNSFFYTVTDKQMQKIKSVFTLTLYKFQQITMYETKFLQILILKYLYSCWVKVDFNTFKGFEVTVNGRSFFGFSDYKVLPNKGNHFITIVFLQRIFRIQMWIFLKDSVRFVKEQNR